MNLAATPADFALSWERRRRFNGLGLILTILVHLLILAAVLTWRSRVTPPSPPRSIDLSLIKQKEAPKPPEPPPLAP
jgi:hypothetical protein